jgi:hypothetical protein
MNHTSKYLLAWMNENDALAVLLGREPRSDDDVSHLRPAWRAARAALMLRSPYRLSTPRLAKLSGKWKNRAAEFQQRPDVIAAFHEMNWSVGMVDLRTVISFQWVVSGQDAAEHRAQTVLENDPDSLFSFCLPAPGEGVTVAGTIDELNHAITFSSQNPNLRVGLPVMADVHVASSPGQPAKTEKFLAFPIHFGWPFLMVAEHNRRLILCDGYHRSYALLRRSIHTVPCVFIRTADFSETGGTRPGLIPYETLFGDRPPMVSDFLDESVAKEVTRTAELNLIRVTAAEFIVQQSLNT